MRHGPSPSDRRAEPVVPAGGCTVTQEILDIALPMILTLAADPIASLVDTAFIGRLGGAGLGQDPLPHPDYKYRTNNQFNAEVSSTANAECYNSFTH